MNLLTCQNLTPAEHHLAEVKAKGDGSFCNSATSQFMEGAPIFADEHETWAHAFKATLFKMLEGVPLHNDDYVGHGKLPKHRRALFWNLTPDTDLIFITKDKEVPMRYGDWLVFDDSEHHGLKTSGLWYGAAWQLRVA